MVMDLRIRSKNELYPANTGGTKMYEHIMEKIDGIMNQLQDLRGHL
jgi:hypothetical protein